MWAALVEGCEELDGVDWNRQGDLRLAGEHHHCSGYSTLISGILMYRRTRSNLSSFSKDAARSALSAVTQV
jgi:hypothetical protein